MSHFSLAVFHYPGKCIDLLLEPFYEGAEVEKYVDYTRQEAIDYARANLRGYENASDDKCWEVMAHEAKGTDEDGNIYSTCNPDAKWDWWEIGGRWSGLLKVGNTTCNSARVKDIDFNSAPFATFAVLTPDGEWIERVSWWGTDTEWNSHYKERFIDTVDPDLILTIVDCHI